MQELLNAAERLATKPVDVIVVDMPLSLKPIEGRRTADRAISAAFGARKCSTHSPSKDRPGPISEAICLEAERLGYSLTIAPNDRPPRALLEAYPHPAILSLTDAAHRVSYKIQRASKYWPKLTPTERRAAVARELSFILDHLRAVFTGVEIAVDASAPKRVIKSLEDAIDALVCCWVGVRWLDGAAEPYGSEEAAIWVPYPQVRP
jgi:predicted RNase H-like nuclease